MKRIPQQSPDQMARDLARAYWKPQAIANQNLAAAKTKAQSAYWNAVSKACAELMDTTPPKRFRA